MLVNPFIDDNAFQLASLSESLNLLPNRYGRIGQMGLFREKGVPTRTILIEERNGVLSLLPTRPVGSPGTVGESAKRNVRSFAIPHIPHDDVILPQEYEGVRAFGSESEMSVLAEIVNDKLQTMKNKHDITHEHLRSGSLRGEILDADGSVLYDLFAEFGVTPVSVNFDLTNANANVPAKCRAVLRAVEDALMGEVMSSVHVLCSEGFFDALIAHDSVKEVFLNHNAAVERLGGDPRKGFNFGGLIFEEYRGKASDFEGTSRLFVGANEAQAFPVGTMQTFVEYFAPADFAETVNTIGKRYYAKQEPRKFGRGVDLHSQSNVLPICLRPGVLINLTKTAQG